MSTTRKNYQKESITWEETRDPEYPYSAKVNQNNYLIRLNDFPDESLYTLIVNNEEIEDLEDWPELWIISTDAQDQRVEQTRRAIAEIPREQFLEARQECIVELKTKAASRGILFRALRRIKYVLSRHS
jgi:hypothetical protein